MALTTLHKVALLVALPVTGLFIYFLVKKNDEDEEEDIRPNVVTSRQTVIEVKVPRSMAGKIIGAQGCKIKQLQDSTGARINFKDENPDDTERTVVIRGTHAGAQQAEMNIRKIVAEQPKILSEEILIPEKCCGRIIGKNGDTVRHMSRTSQAKILVDRSGERRTDGMKTVMIHGTAGAIANAKGLIEEKIEEERAFQARRAVQTSNRQERTSNRRNHGDTLANGPQERDSTAAVAVVEPMQQNGHEEGTAPWKPPSTPATLELDGSWPTEHRDYLQCYVSAVVDAGNFSVQVLNSRSAQLDTLVQDMTQHYQDATKQSFTLPPQVGDVVAAPFQHDDSWYRARVLSVKEDTVELYYLDFGDTGDMSLERIQPLRADYLSLPFQAFECFLANVKPVGDGWTDEASDYFEDLTHAAKWKVVMARTVSYRQTEKGAIPCLDLIDTNGPKDININEELVSKGYAVWSKDDDEAVTPVQPTPRITDGGGEDEDRVAPVQVPSLSQEPACATPEHQHPPPEGAPSITAEDKHLPDPEPANQKCSSKLSSLPAHKSDIAGVDSCVVNPDHSDNDLDLISGDAKVLIPVGVKDSASKMGGVMGTESEDECKGGKGIQDDEEGEKADLVATDDHHMDLDEFSSKTEELLSTVTLMSQLEATKTSEMFSKIDRETKLDLDIEGTTPGGHEKSEDTEIQKQDDLIECETEAELLVELPPEIHELCLELPPESHTESNSTEAEMKTEEGKIVPSVSPVEDQPSDNSKCEVEDIILFDHHELVASAKLPTEDASINDTSKKQSDGLTKSDHLETHSADLGKKTCEEEQLVCLALSDPQDLLGACASPGPLSLADMARNVIGQEPAAAAMPKRNEINNVFAANLENVNIGASALSLTTESPEPHLISALPDVLIKGDTDKPTSTKNDYSCGKSVDRGSRASSESEIEILSEENNTSMTNSLTKSLDLDIKYTKSPIDARSRRGPSEGAISDASSEIDVLCEESLPADPVQLQSQISDEAKGMEPLTEATELPSPVSPIQDDLTSLADSAYASLGRGYETEGSTASLHEETVLPVDSPNKNCAEEVEPTPDDTCSIPDVENESSHSKSKSTGSISDLSAKEDTSREVNTDKTDSQWSKAEDFEVLFGADPRFAMIRPKGSDSAQTDRCDKCMESDSIETMFGADPRIVSTSCMHASAVGMDPWHKCAAELPKEAAMLFGDDPRFGTQTSLHSDTHVHKEKDDSCTLPLKSEPVTCEEDDSSDGEIIEELIEDECATEPLLEPELNYEPNAGKGSTSECDIGKQIDLQCTSKELHDELDCYEKSTLLQNAVLEGNAVPQSDHSNTSTYAEKLKPSMEKQDPDCDITMSDSDVEGTLSTIDDNLITQGNTETDSQSKTNDGALSYRIEGRDYHKEQWQSAFKKVIGGEVDGGETKSDSGVQQCPGETSSKDDQCAPLLTSPCEESSRPKSPAKLRWQKAYEKVCEEELKEGALPSETAAKPCASGATSSLVVESDHPVTEQHPNDETTMKQRWKGAIKKVIDEVEQPQIDKDISPDEAVLPEFSPHLLVPKQSDERPQSPVKEKWQGAFKRIVGEDPPRLSDLPAHYRVSGVGNTTKVHKTGANDAVSDIGKTFELVEPTVEGIGSSSLENSYKADDMEEPSWYDMLLQDSESGSEVEAASQELDDISNELSSGSGFQTIPQAETKSDRAAGTRASLSGTVLYPEWMKKASGTAERPVSPFPSARHEPLSVECDETEPDYVDYVDEERILPRLERSPSLDDIEDKDEEKASEKLEGAPTKVALALQAEEKSGSSGSDPDLNIIKLSDYWEECSDGGLHSESPDPEMFSKALQDYREKKSTLATQNPELASSKIDPDEYEKAVLGDGANNLIDTYLPGQGADSQDVVRTLHSGDDASGQPTGDGCCNSDKCEAHDHESCVVPDMELHRADVNITESILHPSTISQESEGMTPGIQTAEVVDLDKDSLDGDLEDSLEEEASNVLGSKNVELSHIKAIGSVSSHDDDVLSCDSLEDTPGFHYPLPRTSSPSTMSQDSLGDEPSQSLDVAVPEERSHCIEDIDSSFTDDSIEQEEEGQLTGSQLEATVFELEHTPTRETAESSFDRDSLNATGGSFTHSFGIDVIQEEPDQAEGVEEGKRTHSESAKFAPSKIPRRNKRRKVKGGSNPTRNFQYPEDSTAL